MWIIPQHIKVLIDCVDDHSHPVTTPSFLIRDFLKRLSPMIELSVYKRQLAVHIKLLDHFLVSNAKMARIPLWDFE